MLRVAFVLRSTEVQPVFSDLFTLTFNFLIENHWGSRRRHHHHQTPILSFFLSFLSVFLSFLRHAATPPPPRNPYPPKPLPLKPCTATRCHAAAASILFLCLFSALLSPCNGFLCLFFALLSPCDLPFESFPVCPPRLATSFCVSSPPFCRRATAFCVYSSPFCRRATFLLRVFLCARPAWQPLFVSLLRPSVAVQRLFVLFSALLSPCSAFLCLLLSH